MAVELSLLRTAFSRRIVSSATLKSVMRSRFDEPSWVLKKKVSLPAPRQDVVSKFAIEPVIAGSAVKVAAGRTLDEVVPAYP